MVHNTKFLRGREMSAVASTLPIAARTAISAKQATGTDNFSQRESPGNPWSSVSHLWKKLPAAGGAGIIDNRGVKN